MIASFLLLTAVATSVPDSWNELALRRAVALWHQGRADEAIDVLETREAGEAAPGDVRADFLRTYARHARGERGEFVGEARHLAERDVPEWARVLEPLAGLDASPEGLPPAAAGAERTGLPAAEGAPRDAWRIEGTLLLAEEKWEDAHAALWHAERDWSGEGAALDSLAARAAAGNVDHVWNEWTATGRSLDRGAIDRARFEAAARATLDEVTDLHREPRVRRPELSMDDVIASRPAMLPATLGRPGAGAWRRVADAADEVARATAELHRAERDLARETDEVARELAYLQGGAARARAERDSAAASAARALSLLADADSLAAGLDAVCAASRARILARTAAIAERARRNRWTARALRHFRAGGPPRHDGPPEGVPSPAALLDADAALASGFRAWADSFAVDALDRIERARDHVWRPRILDKPGALADAATRRRDRADALVAGIDAARAAATDSLRLAPWRQRVADAGTALASRTADWRAVRVAVAVDLLDRARARHAREGEAIAYALAVASGEAAARAGETTRGGALAREAAERCERFVTDYPESPARSEIRFRLADARLRNARDDFREKVASFVGREPTADDWGRTELAPFLDTAAGLQPYLDILEEDPAWAHRDAALFEAGMILFDEGDPRGDAFLAELVTRFPDSDRAGQAHLRLGDARFEEGEWAAAVPHFEEAASSADPERAAIALYKIAWAEFSRDRFDASARTALRLLAHYDAHPEAAAHTDLRDEAEGQLVHALARGGGATAFTRVFGDGATGGATDPAARRTLADLGHLLRGFSLFDEAAACDSLWLARWPMERGALAAAERLADTRAASGGDEAARAARLALADAFRHDSPWAAAQDDSLRARGDDFARRAYEDAALARHHDARRTNAPADWNATLALDEALLAAWPEHADAPAVHLRAGEASASLGDHAGAVAHFDAAAQGATGADAADAAWHAIVARDAWYESTRPPAATVALGDSVRARDLLGAIDAFAQQHPADARVADLQWREGTVAYRHGWREQAAGALGAFLRTAPSHAQAPAAAEMRGQAFYELERYEDAELAWADGVVTARAAGADSLAADLERRLPPTRFLRAEQRQASAGMRAPTEAAELFDGTAARWPEWEHADRALYRAGLAWASGDHPSDAVRSWSALGERYPESEYARDALVKIAETWEKERRPADAADAYLRLSHAFPNDEDAPVALLTAADLLAGAGNAARADSVRDEYLERFPADVETAMAILEPRARRDLATVTDARPISGLLAAGKSAPKSELARYLALAADHDSLASRGLLAEVRFRRGEEARAAYDHARLSQPLEPAIANKSALLETVLEEYRACSAYGAAPWNRAAAFRIGESLVGFGDALMDSERPSGISGDDALAYDEVLEERSWEFWDRGEETWTALVREAGDTDGEWVEQARARLWPRLAQRFAHVPEVEVPLVPALEPVTEGTR